MDRSTTRALCILIAWIALGAGAARALVVEREDENTHRHAPEDDPGWANVGVCDRWTAVYLGYGWVITAAHVGAGNLDLEGKRYAAVVSSRERVTNPDGSAADLMLFRIDPEPNLPPLKISAKTPPVGTPLVLIGSGLGRGEPTSGEGRVGFYWQEPRIKRWGTSVVNGLAHDRSVGNTDTISTRFSISKTRHEAHAAHGDSGGAAFAYLDGEWQLVGIILAVDNHVGQPDRSSAYGNRTMIADLALYREFVERVLHPTSE